MSVCLTILTRTGSRSEILEFIGVLGYAEASPQVIKQSKSSILLAINRNSLDKVRASFVMSKKDLQIVKVSGAVGKLK